MISSTIVACHDQARVESAATDSAALQQKVVPATETKKEVHYVNTTQQTTAPTEEKKGWSNAAKGAAIGGATGAVAGAVIDKNHRVQGALIGAAAGAGAGYLIGRHKDKKKRRTQ